MRKEMIAMRHRVAALVTTALAFVAATLAWTAPALADTPGFAVNVAQPGTFTVGKSAKALTAVVSTDRARRCHKVRWTLVLRTEGISLDQVQINRVENGRSFEVRARAEGDGARVVDTELDPGEVCRGRTVTARWDIAFTGPDDGRVSFEARAADGSGRVLSTGGASSRVITAVAAKPSASASRSASPSPAFTPEPTEAAAAPEEKPSSVQPAALTGGNSSTGALGPGLIVGAVLVLLGVGLLLRLRSRNRKKPGWHEETQLLPTGFYNLPRK
ncbi:hypothetical protein ACWKSP_15790 [Micromonosporaceae bacterium Da 78-11]